MLANLLLGLGVPQRFAKGLATVLTVLLLLGGIWLALHFYGKHRYDEGVSATDAKWEAAATQLKQDAANSAGKADDNAAERLDNYVQQHASDQEAVNEAERNGTSPLDALFGN
jgi:hypothetical protein